MRLHAAWLAAIVCLGACFDNDSSAQSSWLAIASTRQEVMPVIKAKRRLEKAWPQTTIIASSDCENLKPGLYLAVATAAPNPKTAQEALAKLKKQVPDAYLRQCIIRPNSRLALGIPAVDASIQKVPDTAVNWTDADRVSEVVKLHGAGYLWFRKTYNAAPEDPREGRREAVIYFREDSKQSITLKPDCTDAAYAEHDPWVAVSCADEMATDQLLHQVSVFQKDSSKPVFTVRRCREPKFISDREITCRNEQMDNNGQLQLTEKKVQFR